MLVHSLKQLIFFSLTTSSIAFFPLLITIFVLVGIELYDRNCHVAVFFSAPLKLLCYKRNWNPKKTILKTCATFLLLSYSKILFVSINLIFAVPLYDCSGNSISDDTVLLFDPSVTFFHSNHIPYACGSCTVYHSSLCCSTATTFASLSYESFQGLSKIHGFQKVGYSALGYGRVSRVV